MEIGRSKKASKCTVCFRTLEEAISEQELNNEPCERPNCPLKTIIDEEIQKRRSKPSFRIIEKVERTDKRMIIVPKNRK